MSPGKNFAAPKLEYVSPASSVRGRIRVLCCEGAIGFGGSGKSLVELIRHMPDVEAHILVASESIVAAPRQITVFSDERLAHGPLPDASRLVRYFDDARYLLVWLKAVVKAARACKAEVLHSNNCLAVNLSVLLAGRILGIPVVAHQRGFLARNLRLRVALRFLHTTPVIAISNAIASNLEECGVPRENIFQVYDVVEGPTGDERTLPRGTEQVLQVGMHSVLTGWKGQRTLIQAAAILHRETPGLFRFQIAGGTLPGEESYLAQLEADVASYGLSEYVTFLGHVADVYAFLSGIDISVHASLSPEPLGRVIVESQLAGVCVVAADAGGARELVDDDCGVRFLPGDARSLAGALRTLSLDRDRLRSLAAEGKKRASHTFDSKALAKRVSNIFASQIKRHS